MEEVDDLFEANMWAWQFSSYETHGAGRLLATLENEGLSAEKAMAVKIEHREGAEPKVSFSKAFPTSSFAYTLLAYIKCLKCVLAS